jgi:cardiolipin synthase
MRREKGIVSQVRTDRFFTISNLLSISRALLTIPFAFVMLSEVPSATVWGIAILTVAAVTDKFDGVLARKLNQETEWGRILDPLADKIGIGVAALVLVRLDLIPLWFVLLLLARDVLILAGGVYLKRTHARVPQSNQIGKWTIGVLALTMFCAMLRWSLAADVLLWLSVVLLVLSLALYIRRFGELMKTTLVDTSQ